MLKIIKPCNEYLESYAEAMAEGFKNMTLAQYGNFTPDEIHTNPNHVLKILSCDEPRLVPTPDGQEFLLNDHEIWWAVDEKRFIAAISIRYDTNTLTTKYAGHVGMAVRPPLLNKGYGVKACQLGWSKAKEEFKKRGLTRIMASCNPKNTASARLIQYNGGIYDHSDKKAAGYGPLDIYWIPVE